MKDSSCCDPRPVHEPRVCQMKVSSVAGFDSTPHAAASRTPTATIRVCRFNCEVSGLKSEACEEIAPDVVRTFRSARHGRPTGLHYSDFFTTRAAANEVVAAGPVPRMARLTRLRMSGIL